MILPDIPVDELPHVEEATTAEVLCVGEREAEKLPEIHNWELYIYYM